MRRAVLSYPIVLVSMMALDAAWLPSVMMPVFRSTFGDVLRPQVRPVPALLFYMLYAAGVVYFALGGRTRQGPGRSFLRGALFGLVAYGTYDLTNLATLRVYTTRLAAMDMGWGAFATGLAALIGRWGADRLAGDKSAAHDEGARSR